MTQINASFVALCRRIRSDPRPATAIAAQTDLNDAIVRQIRAGSYMPKSIRKLIDAERKLLAADGSSAVDPKKCPSCGGAVQ